MTKKEKRQKRYYFSDELKSRLAQIPQSAVTVVEAPSGFGKTTAVREYLKENLPQGACEYWYTCLGGTASGAWRGICDLFAEICAETASKLKKLDMPTPDTLTYLPGKMENLPCEKDVFLVIDNFHLVKCDIPHELIHVFSMHKNPKLHIIFIMQHLKSKPLIAFYDTDILTIDASVFFFDKKSIHCLFRMEGLRLTDDEAEKIFSGTDGWIAAIRLQIIHYLETGSFDIATDIDQLVETVIWNRLADDEKNFLLAVSVLDSFTAQQAAIMIEKETLPDNITELVKSNDFIRFFPDKNRYAIHSILKDYLQNLFYRHQSEAFQKQIFRLAGQAYVSESRFFTAIKYFSMIPDFDAILSLPLEGKYLANQREKQLSEYIASLVSECPEETLRKYPVKLLIFAYPMLFDGRLDIFNKLCRLIESVIETNQGDLSREELNKLKGEFALLMSFTAYNDIAKTSEGRKAALKILGGPSSIIGNNMPWTFGGTSALSLFWRESGKLNDSLRKMDECLPYYLKLTHGHGTGADSVFRAEARLMRGDDTNAEILCYKALYDARESRQTGICICAEQVLARIAVMRGDVNGYFTAVKNIRGYAEESSDLYVQHMVDLCMSVINFSLGFTDNYAKWLYDTESIKRMLYAPALPYAQILHAEFLLAEKRYNELFGISQSLMREAERRNYMLPQVYHRIFLAVAKRNNGELSAAKEYLKEALERAIPDGVYLPFAQQECMEEFLAEVEVGISAQLIADALPETRASEYSEAVLGVSLSGSFAALKALCRRQRSGADVIKKAVLRAKSPLTPREREIAQLAKERLSAKEIAEELFIAESTVNSALKSIFGKLDIHSKIELKTKEF